MGKRAPQLRDYGQAWEGWGGGGWRALFWRNRPTALRKRLQENGPPAFGIMVSQLGERRRKKTLGSLGKPPQSSEKTAPELQAKWPCNFRKKAHRFLGRPSDKTDPQLWRNEKQQQQQPPPPLPPPSFEITAGNVHKMLQYTIRTNHLFILH